MANHENQQVDDLSSEVQILRERIDCDSSDSSVRVVSLLETLKALEKQESDFQLRRDSECLRLREEIDEFDKIMDLAVAVDDDDGLDHSLEDANHRLESSKKELATKLRSIVELKRQLDEVPSEAEIIQYELRSSELNAQIQKKHRQTRKQYDTYNALMEINELKLKETSLLNSITVQFQNAITSADGRVKLINSLEGILNGIQQKQEKVDTNLHLEQKSCEALKEKYAAAISDQRQSSSLLKLFQEECAKNERLKASLCENKA